MKILTISGSTRRESTNAYLLRFIGKTVPNHVNCVECKAISKLPIFNQDCENEKTPEIVEEFCTSIRTASGIIISSPEYVHAIPGGLKNAIDWLVSREEIIGKPIALAHASHRGDEALEQLRRVLSTVSERFSEKIFIRMSIASKSADEMDEILSDSGNTELIRQFISDFLNHVDSS